MSQNHASLESSVEESYSSLNSKQKSRILDKIERERRKRIVSQLYIEGWQTKNKNIQEMLVESLDALIKFNPKLALGFYVGSSKEQYLSGINEYAVSSLLKCDDESLSYMYNKLMVLADKPNIKDKNNLFVRSLSPFLCGAHRYFIKNESMLDKKYRHKISKKIFNMLFSDPDLTGDVVPGRQYLIKSLKDTYASNPKLTKDLISMAISHEDYLDYENNLHEVVKSLIPKDFELAKQVIDKTIIYTKTFSKNKLSERELGEILNRLAKYQPTYLETLFENVMKNGGKTIDEDIKSSFYGHLDALIKVNPKTAVTYFEDGLTGNFGMEKDTLSSFSAISNICPGKAFEYYKNGIEDISEGESCFQKHIRYLISTKIDYLNFQTNNELEQLYLAGMANNDSSVRRGTANSLGKLFEINPILASKLFYKAIKDPEEDVNLSVLEVFPQLFQANKKFAKKLFKKLWGNGNAKIKQNMINYLPNLYEQDSITANKYYWELMGDEVMEPDKSKFNQCFGKLAYINPTLFLELYNKGIQSYKKDSFRKKINAMHSIREIAKSIRYLAETVNTPEIKPIEDEGYEFIKSYLDSKYSQNKTEEQIISELTELVHNKHVNYKNLNQILKENKCISSEELKECSLIEIDDYDILHKFTNGGWSNIYLIRDQDETEDDFIKILKLPSKNLDNDNVDKIIKKYGSIDKALNEISKEEKRINSKTISRSRDDFKNYQYRPLPQFLGSQRMKLNDKESLGLISEYIEGKTFEQYFTQERPEEEIIEVFAKTAYSLNYIHTKGFTHNDIKKDNVIVARNGLVFLLDLAFSRFKESQSTIKGVREYTAPERILGGESPTKKADQYSFGVLLYESLTGQKPISYQDIQGDKTKFAEGVYEGELRAKSLQDIKPEINPHLASVIMKCLEYNPKKRYDSMQQVEDELVALKNKI
ncbi:MAG: protein kinase [Nanoarchaeota archaeon]|nr:protein kinase [Nanoarchaeota archaeon]